MEKHDGDPAQSAESGHYVTVTAKTLRPGWVSIQPELSEFRKLMEMERLPLLLEKSLVAWGLENPDAKVRAAIGFVEDGFTIAIHVWYDGVLRRDQFKLRQAVERRNRPEPPKLTVVSTTDFS
jgi:hypothetical protein